MPITLLITTLFACLLSDNLFDKTKNAFTRGDGITLILFFLVFVYYLISMMRNKIDEDEKTNTISLGKAILWTVGGIIAIVLGADTVVNSSSAIAKLLGVSERMISLTIIALGTTLPELVTSISATRKGEYDIAIGNVVGSNIFNIGVVIGVPIAIFGGIGTVSFSYIDIIVMILAALLLFIFSRNDYKITRFEGLIFLLIFIIYYSYVIFV